ncbi:MAG: MerR family transcriptional regulator [Candidatus Methanofastidiosa archaeon]|nr:MerR family transcriptional regulator [Candidatus Methanofastidiosa archaeon]
MDKLLNINEAATIIKVHPETLRRWDREGELVAVKINERGDRRYRESDILEFMSTHQSTISHAQSTDVDGYKIRWWKEQGFNTVEANFHLIAKIYAVKEKEFIGFAFFVDFLEKAKSGISEAELDKLAVEKVKEYIESKKVFDGDIVNFEFFNHTFLEVQNPEWWDGKYSKTLAPGLRVEAHASHPTTIENSEPKAWRVILYFKSKQDDSWLPINFGPKHDLIEYFVWIDPKELTNLDLPTSQKGAEELAVQFGVDRFNETKDENGDRDISRITEKNSACFEGKWVKDSLLPEELMK